MARKKLILFMTVGLGDNEGATTKVANRSAASIKHIRPDYIVFFSTEESRKTIKYIADFIKDDYDDFIEGEDYEVCIIKDMDSFNGCYELFLEKLEEFYDNYKLVADYSSGTKTMAASLAISAFLYNAQLISVGGYREEGFIKEGTESIRIQNFYKLKDSIINYFILELFNNCRYDYALSLVDHLVSPDLDKEYFKNFFKAYYYWDTVQFEKAYEFLSNIDLSSPFLGPLKNEVKNNIKALAMISKSHSDNLKNCYILASLINNAKRRAKEFKFDDGIARLYRSFELIGQIKLSHYGIKTSNVDINLLKDKKVSGEFIDFLEKTRVDGKIKIGLVSDFLLLNELGDNLGKYFVENRKKINNITIKRNNSILAHGLESHSKEEYDVFEEFIMNLALDLDKDMKKFLNETKFPKVDLS